MREQGIQYWIQIICLINVFYQYQVFFATIKDADGRFSTIEDMGF